MENDPLRVELQASRELTRQRFPTEAEPEDEPGDSVPLARDSGAVRQLLRRRLGHLQRPDWTRDITGRMRRYVQRRRSQAAATPRRGRDSSGQSSQAESSIAPEELPSSSSQARRYRIHEPEPQEETPTAGERTRRRQRHLGYRRITTPEPPSSHSSQVASSHGAGRGAQPSVETSTDSDPTHATV